MLTTMSLRIYVVKSNCLIRDFNLKSTSKCCIHNCCYYKCIVIWAFCYLFCFVKYTMFKNNSIQLNFAVCLVILSVAIRFRYLCLSFPGTSYILRLSEPYPRLIIYNLIILWMWIVLVKMEARWRTLSTLVQIFSRRH